LDRAGAGWDGWILLELAEDGLRQLELAEDGQLELAEDGQLELAEDGWIHHELAEDE
jgi:hypothetical protein